jgi:hypothetical protein
MKTKLTRHEVDDEDLERMIREAEADEHEPPWLGTAAFSQAPWWLISAAFHGLVILLLSLITWTVKEEFEEIIQELVREPEYKVEPPGRAVTGEMGNGVIVPGEVAEEMTEGLWPDIVVSEELARIAERGDRFMSCNPELPDTGGAHGIPEAHGFFRPVVFDGMAGGGGEGGESSERRFDIGQLIGIGGNFCFGMGGGTGGGNGTGDGVDTGHGRTPWGLRTEASRRWMIPKVGGSLATNAAVLAGLQWLAEHQEYDGHWDSCKYGAGPKTDSACTGLALLAFLGYGHTERVGKYSDNVRRAVEWLISKQNAEGLVFDLTDAGGHRSIGYPHAMAGLALAEAAGMARVPATKTAAQKAVDYSCNVHQNGEGYEKLGWRYYPKQAGDLSVTGWFIMQLKSAKVAGLRVDHTSFEGARRFLDSVEHKIEGSDKGYGPASAYWYQPGSAHQQTAHRLTAIGSLSRQFLGYKSDELQATVEGFVEKGGVPDAYTPEKVDLYYWYYGTLCVFQQGGEVWSRWNEPMKKALPAAQRKDGDEKGSWDPVGDYSGEWGRVGQTALTTLCLEVYCRYPLMIQR